MRFIFRRQILYNIQIDKRELFNVDYQKKAFIFYLLFSSSFKHYGII